MCNVELKKCIVLNTRDAVEFETSMDECLRLGYRVSSSSCNSKEYKAILVLEEEK